MDINDAGDNPGDGQWMTYGELAEDPADRAEGGVRLAQRHRLRRQPAMTVRYRVLVPTESQNHRANRQFLLGATRV